MLLFCFCIFDNYIMVVIEAKNMVEMLMFHTVCAGPNWPMRTLIRSLSYIWRHSPHRISGVCISFVSGDMFVLPKLSLLFSFVLSQRRHSR